MLIKQYTLIIHLFAANVNSNGRFPYGKSTILCVPPSGMRNKGEKSSQSPKFPPFFPLGTPDANPILPLFPRRFVTLIPPAVAEDE